MQDARAEPHGCVVLRADDGSLRTLFSGDVVGRVFTAALHLSDPRVSEFHAMVSVRGRDVWLLPLRGTLHLNGQSVDKHRLATGDAVSLADGVTLRVEGVTPPRERLLLRVGDQPWRPVGGVMSFIGGPAPSIVPGWRPDASCRLWPDGRGWRLSTPEGTVAVVGGFKWEVDGVVVQVVLDDIGDTPSTHGGFDLDDSLVLVARYDSVHVRMGARQPIVLTGRSARLVSELVIAGRALPWRDVAEVLWPALSVSVLRRRWDVELARLRRTLRARSVRADWVHADGAGMIELQLRDGDEVRDET